ncbi:MAG: HPF/RaiA family ribosome-associated protein [Verrucomicrobiaceae bacterium]|nr:HPF/RaiA family ribosome-associated protein [Verrucomicrobiaceae bacterium]
MKLTVKHHNVRSTNALDSWVEEQIISLQPALQIDEANIILAHNDEASPAYQVNVHLTTPGPDVFADGCDHTLRAAFEKTMTALRSKIGSRFTRRQKRKRTRSHAPLLKAC